MKSLPLALAGFLCGSLTCSSIASVAGGSASPDAAQKKPAHQSRSGTTRIEANEAFGKLPLMFEANTGQVDASVRYISHGQGYSLSLTATVAEMALGGTVAAGKEASASSVLRMELSGADPGACVSGENALPGKVNYFIGNDSAKWRTNIPTFAMVKCAQVYPGIDIVYYGNRQQLEYDFIVAPGANPDIIVLKFSGAREIRVNGDGDLILEFPGGSMRQHRPVVYQEVGGARQEIPGDYFTRTRNEIGFKLGAYDTSRPLVIDPVLSYSTYFRGNSQYATCIAVDSSGNAYITGATVGDLPTTGTPLFGFGLGGRDAFVAKLNASGTALVYSTYLGGDGGDEGLGIAVDASGDAYVTGQTLSTNYPTLNAFQASRNGVGDLFVTRLNATGSALMYSTYLGGSAQDTSQRELGTEVDASGNVYLAGATLSADFPTTANAYQRSSNDHGFMAKLNTNASGAASLAYSTQLDAQIRDVAVDSSGNAYVVGNGATFPTTGKAFQRAARINPSGYANDALILKLDTNPAVCTPEPGTNINCKESLLYSTYLGGTDAEPGGSTDIGTGIAVDSSGKIYITGKTGSTDFPTTDNAFQSVSRAGGKLQAFVVKLDPDPPTCTADPGKGIDCKEALLYSTYLGGTALPYSGDEGKDIALDAAGNIYVTGCARSSDFPVKAPIHLSRTFDAFVAKLNPNAFGDASLVYSTYLGGGSIEEYMQIAVDPAGDAYVAGATRSGDFPTTPGAFQTSGLGLFVAKLSADATPFFASAISPGKGGDTGSVSVTVYGAGFKTGATVKLVRSGQPDIPARPVTVKSEGEVIVRFDLTGKQRGLWDIVVTNPGGASATLPAAFTIEAGIERGAKVEVIGPTYFRPGSTLRVVVTYSNPGNVDILVPLIIHIPAGMAFSLPVPPLHTPLVPVSDPVDFSELLTSYPRPDNPATPQNEAGTVIPLIVNVPPGATGNFPVNVRHVDANCTGISISATAGDPFTAEDHAECFVALVQFAAEVASDIIPGGECVKQGFELVSQAGAEFAVGRPSSLSSWIGSLLLGVANCLADAFPVAKALKVAVKVMDLILSSGAAVAEVIEKCQPIQAMEAGYAGTGRTTLNTGCVTSSDPNDKFGPSGSGTGHSISKEQALPYLILFENKPAATAPAQTVVIADQLDATKVDLSTLSLGLITFGDKTVIPPSGLKEFTTDVDLRPGNNLLVRIDAKLNVPTGLLTWRFDSIDPATGQPTEDPLAGFLPPNVNSPQGDGSVFFTVMPKSGLSHGTEIRNQASIVFDTNAAILTPEWLNTIDDSVPASQVLTLSPLQAAGSFEVMWSGTDTGSGIGSYSVFVSTDGGPFTEWLHHTAATSGIFAGQPNTNYAFYSVANDQAGHREVAPAGPDTSTRTPAALTIRREGDDIVVEWTVTGRLQTSDRLASGFQDVPGATSPHRWRIDTTLSKFWRVAR